MPSDRASRRRSVRRAALFNEINHGLGIQWNVTAASNYWWRGHEKYIRVLLAIMALCLKAVGATTSAMKRWASETLRWFRVHIFVCNNSKKIHNRGRFQKRKLGQKHFGNNGTLFKGSRSDDINDEAVDK